MTRALCLHQGRFFLMQLQQRSQQHSLFVQPMCGAKRYEPISGSPAIAAMQSICALCCVLAPEDQT